MKEYEAMKSEGAVFGGKGFIYQNELDETYIKFHMDDHPRFSAMGDTIPFGDN